MLLLACVHAPSAVEESAPARAPFPETHYRCPREVAAAAEAGVIDRYVEPWLADFHALAHIEVPEDFESAEQLILVDKDEEMWNFQRSTASALRGAELPRLQRSVLLLKGAAYMIQAGFVLRSPEPTFIPVDQRGGWREHIQTVHDAILRQAYQGLRYMGSLPGLKRDADLQEIAARCLAEIGTLPDATARPAPEPEPEP